MNDGRLFAVNADNGKLCETFANKGILNLQTNMPVTTPGMYEPTSPPIITDKTIVIAGAVTDNFSTREPSGVIRGFDVNTGKLLWAFDPGAKDPNAIRAMNITSRSTRRTHGRLPPTTLSWIWSICRWA
ncbi:glucose dehydrogenase [Klebsiella pneumoniae]|uniref:Glucose dehydrogenase n=1 Tax=Klebsiella pneumoniae TaxID=573 RepID=A0A377ZMU3_KLEPN|nr:glucose dehydrogenase [Klebsiella pneumoniae]